MYECMDNQVKRPEMQARGQHVVSKIIRKWEDMGGDYKMRQEYRRRENDQRRRGAEAKWDQIRANGAGTKRGR